MESNEVLDKLPRHLLSLIIEQPYNEYTAQDHAVWRFVMRQNVNYLSKVAHHSYVDGLRQTGISIDEIPHMYGMNRILKEIGWAAVAVDGFIPPSAFMEFQAYNVLVIAADIRPIDQVEYTPAPDIIHEAAGHAPIIADEEYAAYLRYFGYIGSKAFSSSKDYELYEAIRHLSILKADPYTTPDDIETAASRLAVIEKDLGEPSEMSRIRNLHWWTVEYGLVGNHENPRIYGAGLLSSIGESQSSLQAGVKKLPYNIEAANVGFDITTRQPQLFVTPDFNYLTEVLNEFADTMALRRGGSYGVKLAVESGKPATVVYSSGLQVSGVFSVLMEHQGRPSFIKTSGLSDLCYNNKELEGHGVYYHHEGFSSPVGKWKASSTPPELLSDGDLEAMGIMEGHEAFIEFETGFVVKGKLIGKVRKEGKLLVLSLTDCTVSYRDRLLYMPEWGPYDMAVGSDIVSAFSGPADPDAFIFTFQAPTEKTHKIIHSQEALKLHQLYQRVRNLRSSANAGGELRVIYDTVISQFPNDWLLPLEILELAQDQNQKELAADAQSHLRNIHRNEATLRNVINNGFNILNLAL